MQIILPEKVKTIIRKLQDEGFEAYTVGGCVRDSYLGRTPNDWDITTNALPSQVKSLFRRTVDIGIEHGTVKVMLGDDGYEVTTYRIDGEYMDSRHPSEVTFTGSLEEDLKRRDFTMNAMAYSERDGLIDLFGGIEDIKNKRVKAVGDARQRFTEDALRIMRAVRFSAQLGYDIEEETYKAACELAPTLAKISSERIREEFEKLILSDNPDRMRTMYEMGITKIIMPDWDVAMECPQNSIHHYLSVGEHTICALNYDVANLDDSEGRISVREMTEAEKRIVRITLLLHDFGKPVAKRMGADGYEHFTGHPEISAKMAVQIMKSLKYDNATIEAVRKLTLFHDERPELDAYHVRRMMVDVGVDRMPMLLRIKKMDLAAHSNYNMDSKKEELRELNRLYNEIASSDDCLSLKELAVKGSDLIAAGVEKGPKMGELLNELFDKVLQNPEMNTKELLLKEIAK